MRRWRGPDCVSASPIKPDHTAVVAEFKFDAKIGVAETVSAHDLYVMDVVLGTIFFHGFEHKH